MNIITGYRGEPHITSQQKRNTNIGIFGSDARIIGGVNSELEATIVSANLVEISDGMIVCEGCTAEIPRGTNDSLVIENGEQGMKRIDLIVARYTRNANTGAESMELAVIKGTSAASEPTTPSYNTGLIADGDSPVDFPIYQVNIDGISITSVDALVDVVSVPSMVEEVRNGVDELNAKTDKFFVFRFPSISTSDDLAAIGAALQSILSRGYGDITFVCYIFRTGAWQLNGFGSVRSNDARATFVNCYNGQIVVVSRTTTSALTVIRTL